MTILNAIRDEFSFLANKQKAQILQSFFKTKKGEYGEGDIFIGITIPELRKIAKKYYQEIALSEIQTLLHSKIHEDRSLALFLLIQKFEKTKNTEEKDIIVKFYLADENIKFINNWDLVDISCYKILGEYLLQNENETKILYNFAKSENLWLKRIAIISTFAFIRKNNFLHTIEICKLLIQDKHDLINKAVGWMLREVGKRDKEMLINFLNLHYTKMARISVGYATEKLTQVEKNSYKK